MEAAAQILERRGSDAFNTNEVAERAGVSIGTLYQYFPDKRAILLAAARRELAASAAPLSSRGKALVQGLIAMLEGLGFGAGSPQAQSAKARSASRKPAGATGPKRRQTWDRQALDLIADWLAPLASPQVPTLRPIPIRRRPTE